jgi:hypothetical protein
MKEGSHVKKKKLYCHLLFDSRFKNFVKNVNLEYLMEALNEKNFYLFYTTFFSLLPLQKGSLLQQFWVEKLIKQQNLREKPFLSFKYDPKRQKRTTKGNIYNQELAFSLKISFNGSFEDRTRLLHQKKPIFPLSTRIFPSMSEPQALESFQKDHQINSLPPAS